MAREGGTVATWRGVFGFLTPASGGRDVFCHFAEIEGMDGFRELEPGQRVTFERGADPSGRPCALAVRHA